VDVIRDKKKKLIDFEEKKTHKQKKTKRIDSNIYTHLPAICINGFKPLNYVSKF